LTEQLNTITASQSENLPAAYEDLSALMLNCTLTRSPRLSHTEGFTGLVAMAAALDPAEISAAVAEGLASALTLSFKQILDPNPRTS
jgi:hypothetical protein